jgi:predicted nuclease of predicted toxin-antitoxin system
MKLLFDENLPPALVGATREDFPGSLHVHSCGLGAVDDAAVWDYAKAHGCTIVTKDSDYEERSVLLGAPPKVIWLRTGNCTTEHLVSLLALHSPVIRAFAKNENETVLEIS